MAKVLKSGDSRARRGGRGVYSYIRVLPNKCFLNLVGFKKNLLAEHQRINIQTPTLQSKALMHRINVIQLSMWMFVLNIIIPF